MLETTDIKKLFAVLQARYGHRFTSWLDDPDVARIAVSEWHRELQGFRPEDIRRALSALPPDWPPTLMQFVKLCMPPLEDLGLLEKAKAEYQRRLPSYYWEPDGPREAARRDKIATELWEKVLAETEAMAMDRVRTEGVAGLLAQEPQAKWPRSLLELAKRSKP